MSERRSILDVHNDIDTAIQISYSTLSVMCDRAEDERVSWALMGVMEQIGKIKESVKLLRDSSGGRVAEV